MKIDREKAFAKLMQEMQNRCDRAFVEAQDIRNTDSNFSDEVSTILTALNDLKFLLDNME